MKKHLLIAGLICMVIIPPASAVTKCVKLSSSTTCSNSSYSGLDWNATCKTNNTNVSVNGIAGCSSKGGSRGNISANLLIDPTADYNNNCWCKMTSPATSQWTFAYSFSSGGDCLTSCSYYCVFSFGYDDFRTRMFGSLSD